jgi:hypothetical protein
LSDLGFDGNLIIKECKKRGLDDQISLYPFEKVVGRKYNRENEEREETPGTFRSVFGDREIRVSSISERLISD